jgi:hypothetical protein
MTANWTHGPIYCSSITASLVLQQIKVDPEYVVRLPMHHTVNIEGVDVTLIDANQFVLCVTVLIVVVLDQCYFSLRKRWPNGHFEYYTVAISELHHIIFNILPFEENISMQSISTPRISSTFRFMHN